MKKSLLAVFLAALMVIGGCGQANKEENDGGSSSLVLTDYMGNQVAFEQMPQRVVALSGSFGEIWLNAGGSLVGATEDAVSERGLDLDSQTTIVGTVKSPDLEAVLACEPDFVIMSADITGHGEIAESLKEAQIAYGLFHVEYFDDYLALLDDFTDITGRKELYKEKGEDVKAVIEDILSGAPDLSGKTVLLLRAYSSGFKAKDSQNMTGAMLADFGFENILDKYDALMEDISLEEIITADPDYIFVTTMGSDTQAAIDNLKTALTDSPAWSGMTAVSAGRYHILPQELFHYKPNDRWGESYEYLLDILSNG